MGFFGKLFKGPEVDMEKSNANAKKMRLLFDQAVEGGSGYRLIFGYTEDVSRFNYGFVHGSKTKIGNLIVGWNEANQTIVVVPTVPDLSGCGDPTYYRRSEILKAYRNKYPTDAFIIYPDKKGYIGINAYDWLEDEKLYVYVSQADELAAFTKKYPSTSSNEKKDAISLQSRTSKYGFCKSSKMTVNRIRTTHFAVSTISAGLGKKWLLNQYNIPRTVY